MSTTAKKRDIAPGGYSKNDFFLQGVTTQDPYEKIDFVNSLGNRFVTGGIVIVCDSANLLDFSFDGVNLHGTLSQNESVSFDNRNRECIFVKPNSSGNNASYRIWAW